MKTLKLFILSITITLLLVGCENLDEITVTPNSVLLYPNETIDLSIIFEPTDIDTDKLEISWNSGNQDVALIDSNGELTTVDAGETSITISDKSTVNTKCDVIVENPNIIKLAYGEKYMLPYILKIFNDDDYILCSSDDTVVTINEYGEISTIDYGETVIIARNNNIIENVCYIIVDEVQIVELEDGKKFLASSYLEVIDTSSVINWISSDESIATIDSDGVISAQNVGTTYITAYTDTQIETIFTLSVYEIPTIQNIEIEGLSELDVNSITQYSLSISPDEYKAEEIIWTSSNEDIAIIDNYGKLTSISEGIVTITATTSNTNISDSLEITINSIPLTMSIAQSKTTSIVNNNYYVTLSMEANAIGGSGTGYKYKFEIYQNGTITKNTGWASNDSISATLDGNGTCKIKIYVKDSEGEQFSQTIDLLDSGF